MSQSMPVEKRGWSVLREAEGSFNGAPTRSLAMGSPPFGSAQPGGLWPHTGMVLGCRNVFHVPPKERGVGSRSRSWSWCCSPFLAGGAPRCLLPSERKLGMGGGASSGLHQPVPAPMGETEMRNDGLRGRLKPCYPLSLPLPPQGQELWKWNW